MNEIVYIKMPQNVVVDKTHLCLGDFLKLYTNDKNLRKKIQAIPFYHFPDNKAAKIVVSILSIIEIINLHFPDVVIENSGEADFIISYKPINPNEKRKEIISTIFLCLVSFIGGGYAIMAYSVDVGAKELFNYLSTLFLGNPQEGNYYIAIAYAIGLSLGMIIFFNHFGSKKLSSDPTPLEVQMRLYEKDVDTAIIKDLSRRGENMDATQ